MFSSIQTEKSEFPQKTSFSNKLNGFLENFMLRLHVDYLTTPKLPLSITSYKSKMTENLLGNTVSMP